MSWPRTSTASGPRPKLWQHSIRVLNGELLSMKAWVVTPNPPCRTLPTRWGVRAMLALALFAAHAPQAHAQATPPSIITQPFSSTNAIGSTATFVVEAVGTAPLTYQWYRHPLSPIADATNATLVLTNVQSSDSGVYHVAVINEAGSTNSIEASLLVRIPPSIIQHPVSLIVTQGSPATFAVLATGDGPRVYQWLFNDTNAIPSATNTSVTLTNLQPAQSGRYSVHISNDVGAVTSSPAILTVRPIADLRLGQVASTNRVATGNNATFTINVTNTGPSTAAGVSVVSRLSSRSTFVSAASPQGSCTHLDGIVTCNVNNLAVNERATITLVARIGQGTNITVTSASSTDIDPSPTNNVASTAVVGISSLPQLANTDAIILPLEDPGPGSVYPAEILVSGQTNSVYKVTVTVRGITHDYPDDIDILLVGPRGQKTYLMSDAGSDSALVDVSVTFDDDAAAQVPDTTPPIVTGGYRPGNYQVAVDAFTSPAPPPPYVTNLTVFRGTDPNGIWSLYVMDDSPLNATINSPAGFIADGWTLSITTADPMTDLVLTQTDQPDPVIVGSNLFYTITVTNRGPSSSTAIVRDVLPPTVNFVSAATTRGDCVNEAGTVVCSLRTLASGAGGVIIIEVAPTVGARLTNIVTVAGNQMDLNPADNSATNVTTVLAVADLSISLTPSSTSLLLSQPATFSIHLTNRGPNTATSVRLTNTLPAGFNLSNMITSQGACTNTAGVVVCALGNVSSNAVVSIQLIGAAGNTGLNTNFVTVTAAELDFTLQDNSAGSAITVSPASDITVSAITKISTIPLAQDFTSTLLVTNRGPSLAQVTLDDQLPPGVSLLSVVPSRGSCSNVAGTVRCDFGTMNSGDTANVVIAARTTAIGPLTNFSVVVGSLADLNPGNNSATNVAVVIPAADLTVTLADRPDPLWLGDNLLYTITITNHGPSTTSNVLLNHSLPPGINVISVAPTGGACVLGAGSIDCSFPPLGAGAGASVGIAVRPTQPGLIPSTATVSSALVDPVPADNVATQSTRGIVPSIVSVSPSLIIIPRQGIASPYPSTISISGMTAAVFQVRVSLTNLTHSYADDVDILLVGPNGRAVMLMSDCGGDFPLNGSSLTFDDGATNPLPDSTLVASGTYRPTGYEPLSDLFPTPAPSGPYDTNLAVFNGIDPNGPWSLYIMDDADKDSGVLSGGWALTLSTLEPIADLVLRSTFSGSPAGVSSNIVFTHSITNRGPATAVRVRLTNALPITVQSVSATSSRGTCLSTPEGVICDLGDMPSGAIAAITISGRPVAADDRNLLVTLQSDLLDLNPQNNSTNFHVVFEHPPIITLQPVSLLVTNGDTVQLSSAASGTEPLAYQWLRNGISVPGATAPTLIFPNIAPANSGAYQLRVTNRVGIAFSDTASLSVFGPPTISDLPDLTIDEDSTTGPIPFTVVDFETPPESIQIVAGSSHPEIVPLSSIQLTSNGSNHTIQVTPPPNQFGVVTISILATDTDNGVTTNSFLLTIASINDLPSISSVAGQSTTEDVAIAVPFTVHDLETPPDSLTYALTSSNPALVSGANVTFSGTDSNRLAIITPATNQSGSASVLLTITDGDGASATATFSLSVQSINDHPTLAQLADLTVDEDSGPHDVNLAGITSGAPNEAQHLTVVAHSSNPAVIPNPTVAYSSPAETGLLTFTPLTNATGTVVITVSVKDGQTTNQSFSQTFTVHITPANDAPSLSDIADQIIDEDTPLSLPFIVTDPDDSGTNLVLTATSSDPDLFPNASLSITGTNGIRVLHAAPAANRFGEATITITATDTNGAVASHSFLLTVSLVNDPPTLDDITARTIAEDAPQQTVNLAGIGSGAFNESQAISITATSSNPALISGLTVSYTTPNVTGSLNFRPATNATGTAAITVLVDDGQSQNHLTTRSFTVTVTGTNDRPRLTGLGDTATDEDVPVAIPFTVTDPDNLPLLLSLTATSLNTNLVAATNLSISGAGSDRTLLITPNTNQSGNATISVIAGDGTLATTNTFSLTVNPVNDAPTLNPLTNLNVTVSPGSLSIPLTGIGSGATNETQALTITASTTNPGLFINQPGVSYPGTGTTGTLTFRPANNTTGSAPITVTVNDGGAVNPTFSRTFTFNVRAAANAQPTISIITNQTTWEDTPTAAISFVVNDEETLAGGISVTASSSNTGLLPNANIVLVGTDASRTITLTPAPNQSGSSTVTMVANDGQAGSSNLTFTLTVVATNDAPDISAIPSQSTFKNTPTGLIPFTLSDVDHPASALLVSATSANTTLVPNANIALGGTGAQRGLVITPATNETGNAAITVRVTDGIATNSTTFTLTVTNVDDAPSISAIANQSTDEDTTTGSIAFHFRDADTALDALTIGAISSNPALVSSNGLALAGTGTNRDLTITPLPNQSGTAAITVLVSDGVNVASQSFTLTVHPVNDAPTIDAIADVHINENSPAQTIGVAGLGSGAPDENQALAVTASSDNPTLIANVAVSYNSPASTAALTFIPIPNTNGSATITVFVSDGQSSNSLASRAFTVFINAAPTIADVPDHSTSEDVAASGIVFAVDDRDGLPEQVTVTGTSSNPALISDGGILVQGTGTNRFVIVTPVTNQFGTAIITLHATDTNGAAGTNQFLLVVEPVVDPVLITSQPQNLSSVIGGTVTFSVGATSSLFPLSYQWQRDGIDVTGATNATLVVVDVQPSLAGSFHALVSNADATAASAAAQLQVLTTAPSPAILAVTRNASNVDILFTTVAGTSYTLEFKNSLATAEWTPLGSIPGTGAPATLSDSAVAEPTRFYRVRVN